jgi:3-(3-hydroxy-phenyl)propionate hydroxylase
VSKNQFDYDLVIVGLGPTGSMLAGLARLEGLKILAVDREIAVFPLPRAAVFDDEVMRIFQRLGVAEYFEPLCRTPEKYEFVAADGEVLLDFPVLGAPTVSGWEPSYILHQPTIESALRDRIKALGVEMQVGKRFVGFEQDEDGVDVKLTQDGHESSIRCRYLVGCDGARSPVRQAAGMTQFDYDFNEPWLVIDALSDAHDLLPSRAMQICDPARPTTYLKMTGRRYRWEFMMLPGETAEQMLDDSFIKRLLEPWGAGEHLEIERKALYRFSGMVSEQWRKGRVLLAGDAAHQMPPFAGQGMCAGIRDAGNLSWKLGQVIRGQASETLLDSYQSEREAHVRFVIENAIGMGRIICLTDPAAAAGRNAEMRARRASGVREVTMNYPGLKDGFLMQSPSAGELFPQQRGDVPAMDDVLGAGFWLIGRDLPAEIPVQVRAYDLSDKLMAPYADGIVDWLKEQGASAVLVRPDRHVFGCGEPAALLAEMMRQTEKMSETVISVGNV